MATNISSYGPQPQLSVTAKVKQIETITISDDDEDNKEEETHIIQSSLGSQMSQDPNIPNLILDSFTNSQEISAQKSYSVARKTIETIDISDDEDNKEDETHTFQIAMDSHKSQDHNIPNPILDSSTNRQEISAQKSCIVQKRESVIRKLIETIDISDDEDYDPTHTDRTSPEPQKPDFSTSKSHQIPACLTSWKKQTTNLDEKIFCGSENQSVLLNLTDLHSTQQTSPSASFQPNITQDSETAASFQCSRNHNKPERTFSVIHGPYIRNISVIKEVTLEPVYVSVKSGKTVLNTYPDPEVTEDEAQHDDSTQAQILTDVKEQVGNSSENRSETFDTGHVTDQVKSTNISSIVEGVGDIRPNSSSWKMTARKSCSGLRESHKRKPIGKIKFLDDKCDPTSLVSQKSHVPNTIPDTTTSLRKCRDRLDKNVLGRTKKQEADLNLTRVGKSGSHPSSKCRPIPTDAVRKSKTLRTRMMNQRNIPATANKGATILVNSALNKVKLVDESDNVSGKAEAASGPPSSMVTPVRLEQVTASDLPPEIASSSKSVMRSKLLGKDAVNAKFQKQKRRPAHKMKLRKITVKKCLAQKQQPQSSGDDSSAASILTTRKPLLRNQKQGQQRDHRFLLLHDKNLTRVTPGSLYYICNFCSKTFEKYSKGRRHVRVHTGDKPYECSHCGKKFSRKDNAKQHQNFHADNQEFKCKFCTKIFLHWCSRRKHQNICGKKKN